MTLILHFHEQYNLLSLSYWSVMWNYLDLYLWSNLGENILSPEVIILSSFLDCLFSLFPSEQQNNMKSEHTQIYPNPVQLITYLFIRVLHLIFFNYMKEPFWKALLNTLYWLFPDMDYLARRQVHWFSGSEDRFPNYLERQTTACVSTFNFIHY